MLSMPDYVIGAHTGPGTVPLFFFSDNAKDKPRLPQMVVIYPRLTGFGYLDTKSNKL